MRTGTADLPLHGGRAPAWLMQRMIRLARAVVEIMVSEYDTRFVLQKLADPFWFQAFGCLLGFDWHSSGLTTTVCAALKAAFQTAGSDFPLYACGGKGSRSRRTPEEIAAACDALGVDADPLIYASRMAAKIDNAALQDGFQIYHHCFFFDRTGLWAVVQQGMARENDPLGRPNAGFARRYHWVADKVGDWTIRPEAAICSEKTAPLVVDTIAKEARPMQQDVTRLLTEEQREVQKILKDLPHLRLTPRHRILLSDIDPRRISRILLSTYDDPPETFASLIGRRGIGPATIRALALTAEIIYGHGPSYRDPARFSFAHGGKDGTPYPVRRDVYDETISILNSLVSRARVDQSEKRRAFRRLAVFTTISSAESQRHSVNRTTSETTRL
ncbi:MAG: DUF763 domain-containing protein [Verrucomicrobia bacterium]|nr:MAG: DUF763 domain-containing protein [Verrucomicrobiota bacterium]